MSQKDQIPPPHPFKDLPDPLLMPERTVSADLSSKQVYAVPDACKCRELWDRYGMLPNIRRHSEEVAKICRKLAERASEKGIPVSIQECLAAGLLHDLAKTSCLRWGGSHAMLGSAWIVMETGNYDIAQGVLLHVHWPWPLPRGDAVCCLPIFLIYADKRVRHDSCVTLRERFEDLLERYGHTEAARRGIKDTWAQTVEMEKRLSRQLDWKLDEYSFD